MTGERDVQVLPEQQSTDNTDHVLSRTCWCLPTLMVGGGWIRVVHREVAR